MILVNTKFGASHKRILRQYKSSFQGNTFTWSDWKKWMYSRDRFKSVSSDANSKLNDTKQWTLKLNFKEFYEHMRLINDQIKHYDLKEENFQNIFLKAISDDYCLEFMRAINTFKVTTGREVIPADMFYSLGEKAEKEGLERMRIEKSKVRRSTFTRPTGSNFHHKESVKFNVVRSGRMQSKESAESGFPEEYALQRPLSHEGRTWCYENNACTFCRVVGHRFNQCSHSDKKEDFHSNKKYVATSLATKTDNSLDSKSPTTKELNSLVSLVKDVVSEKRNKKRTWFKKSNVPQRTIKGSVDVESEQGERTSGECLPPAATPPENIAIGNYIPHSEQYSDILYISTSPRPNETTIADTLPK
jgi:hypothetical protein